MQVTVKCVGKNRLAKFTCTGDKMGCMGRMSNERFNSHMRICHPGVNAHEVNVEARRKGQASFTEGGGESQTTDHKSVVNLYRT